MPETKADLRAKIEELENALRDKSSFQNSVARAEGTGYTMVPVKNWSSTSVSIEYEYKGLKTVLILDPDGSRSVGAIPLETWTELERSSKLVSDGYIARTDKPVNNPNVIEDSGDYINNCTEGQLVSKLAQVTNVHVVHRLLRYIEALKEKSGKDLAAQTALRNRIFELSGVRIVDEEE